MFCLLAQKEKRQVNPLNLEQWEFYVIPTSLIDKGMGDIHSITLARVRKDSHPYKFRQLQEAITEGRASPVTPSRATQP